MRGVGPKVVEDHADLGEGDFLTALGLVVVNGEGGQFVLVFAQVGLEVLGVLRGVGGAAVPSSSEEDIDGVVIDGLEVLFAGLDDVGDKRAHRGVRGRRRNLASEKIVRGHSSGQKPHGGGFDIAFDAGDLAGKAQVRPRLQPHLRVQQRWRIEESVAVDAAQAGKAGVLKTGNHPEDISLRAVFHLGQLTFDPEAGLQTATHVLDTTGRGLHALTKL